MPSASPELIAQSVDTIRMLAADAVQKAGSGHPGMPMGAADMAFVLWTRHLRYDPREPRWLGRDRFVLSAGHGSMLLYGMLHLSGYELSMDDLKSFRQLHSRTPGHPEFGFAPGVEVTSGPLGQGFANGVGMALGHAMLSAQLGRGNPLEEPFVYSICGDGDLMEGVTAEAASFAGHQGLGRLVYLYDDNGITIDGKTTLSFTGEDVTKRFEAYGWHVQSVPGRDHEAISAAIDAAKADPRPSLIRVKTTIGFGSPKKAGTSAAHGAPLGVEELAATKKALGWPSEPPFLVPDDVRAFWSEVAAEKRGLREAWNGRFAAWRAAHAAEAAVLDAHVARTVPADLRERLVAAGGTASEATRKLSHAVIQAAAAAVPALVGGSADLAESNLTEIKGGGTVERESYGGRNIPYGIREHAMGAIANGLAYDGLFIPFSGTFLIFSDYMRPPVRLAALSGLQAIFVWTHDSIFLGEDGPTHQPIEQLTSLRAIPNLHVVRPADGLETAEGWAHALARRNGPTAFILSRQKIAKLDRAEGAERFAGRGGYVVKDAEGARFTVVATGSEVASAQGAVALLAARGIPGRLVSMPCLERFGEQDAAYQEAVIPSSRPVVVVEAARGLEWWRLAGKDGLVLGIDRFGASAPEKALVEEYGFSPEKIASRIEAWLPKR